MIGRPSPGGLVVLPESLPARVVLLEAMVEAVERRWHEPDHGLWEARLPPRHHVYSKVMCWLTVDRAVKLAAEYGRDVEPSWPGLRDEIAHDVLTNGWNDEVRSFTTAYDGTDLDAALALHGGNGGGQDLRRQQRRAAERFGKGQDAPFPDQPPERPGVGPGSPRMSDITDSWKCSRFVRTMRAVASRRAFS